MAARPGSKVLTRGPEAGAISIVMDPGNPRVLYAGFWQMGRKPWRLDSGGPGSGIWKSDRWRRHLDGIFTHAPGLPRGVEGRIGIAVSPANPEGVWALVEAADGGVFRSDGGE